MPPGPYDPPKSVSISTVNLALHAVGQLDRWHAAPRAHPPVFVLLYVLAAIGRADVADLHLAGRLAVGELLDELEAEGMGSVVEAYERRRPGEPGGERIP
jgi:hypothetical protein